MAVHQLESPLEELERLVEAGGAHIRKRIGQLGDLAATATHGAATSAAAVGDQASESIADPGADVAWRRAREGAALAVALIIAVALGAAAILARRRAESIRRRASG